MLGYTGGNGPIFDMLVGTGKFDGYFFIGGAFNNLPAIVMWQLPSEAATSNNNHSLDGTGLLRAVGDNGNRINGLVTTITQVCIYLTIPLTTIYV
jgi:hypothetical protein